MVWAVVIMRAKKRAESRAACSLNTRGLSDDIRLQEPKSRFGTNANTTFNKVATTI
jgi:hypothetical protein